MLWNTFEHTRVDDDDYELGGQERLGVVGSHVEDEYCAVEEADGEQVGVLVGEVESGHARLGLVESLGKLGVLQRPAAHQTRLLLVVLELAVADGQYVAILLVPAHAAHVALLAQRRRVRPQLLQADHLELNRSGCSGCGRGNAARCRMRGSRCLVVASGAQWLQRLEPAVARLLRLVRVLDEEALHEERVELEILVLIDGISLVIKLCSSYYFKVSMMCK